MAHRDEYADTGRDGSQRKTREEASIPVDTRPMTAEWEAKRDRAEGRPTHGTRGYADTEAFERDRSY